MLKQPTCSGSEVRTESAEGCCSVDHGSEMYTTLLAQSAGCSQNIHLNQKNAGCSHSIHFNQKNAGCSQNLCGESAGCSQNLHGESAGCSPHLQHELYYNHIFYRYIYIKIKMLVVVSKTDMNKVLLVSKNLHTVVFSTQIKPL